ncbi:MAG: hypothetical protein K2H09_07780 [Treponemataceae bacterium]|nr:hypothetical protein [Treponemataceae bacterium]
MKKCKSFLILFFLLFSIGAAAAQAGVEPEGELYADAVGWYLKGYVEALPQLKPYPAGFIRRMLAAVAERGDPDEAEKARHYEARYFSKPWNVSASGDMDVKLYQLESGGDKNTRYFEDTEFFAADVRFAGDAAVSDLFSASWNVGVVGMNSAISVEDAVPLFVKDSDRQKIDTLFVDCGKMDLLFDFNGIVSVGTGSLYGTFGLNKAAFGLYPDSDILLNPSAVQMLNASFNYSGRHFEYVHLLAGLAAADYTRKSDCAAGKFLAFHSIRLPLFKRKLCVSYYESVIYGKRFAPAYLMPVPFAVVANVSGFNENVIAGLQLEWRPLPCIVLTANAAFDDLQPKSVLKLKLNDAAVRTAFKTGFIYTPLDSICSQLSFDYTLVTPYTYTSYYTEDRRYNYSDYTNCGMYIGSELPPNSDRCSFRIAFKPIPTLKLSTLTTFVRHGNAAQSWSDEDVMLRSEREAGGFISDGGVEMNSGGLGSASDATDFLKQSDIMYIIQAGISAEYEFRRTKAGVFSISAGYTFEYVRNDGVDSPLYPGTYASAEAVQAARNAWRGALHDSFQNYFSVGFTYVY